MLRACELIQVKYCIWGLITGKACDIWKKNIKNVGFRDESCYIVYIYKRKRGVCKS